jgi:hypothetical protein
MLLKCHIPLSKCQLYEVTLLIYIYLLQYQDGLPRIDLMEVLKLFLMRQNLETDSHVNSL